MKNKFTLFLFLAAIFTCISVAPAHALIITLDVQDADILVGESFDVVVSVQDDTNSFLDLLAFGFNVDPAASLTLITYDSATLDPYFADAGTGGNYVGGAYIGPLDAGNDPTLATLSFTAGLTPGTNTLQIEGINDGFFEGLYYESPLDPTAGFLDIIASVDITVNEAAVPEPATLLLIGTGLVGLAGFRRKFRKSTNN